MLHELRVGEVARLGLSPLARYYGTVDATPLFLCLLCEHADWSGDLSLFRELRGEVDAMLGWIDGPGDRDGDGLLEYRQRAPAGLRNQGWKDSDEGVLDEHGTPLEPPIALVEPQAYALRAKRRLARLFALDGDEARARAAAPRPTRCASGWSASGCPSAATTRWASAPTGGRARRSRPTRATCCGRSRCRRSARGGPRRADVGRDVLRLGDPHARRGRGRLQPGRLPPRDGLAARHGDDRLRAAQVRLRRRLHADLRGAARGRGQRRGLPAAGALRRASRGRSSRRPCRTRSPASRRPGRPARSRTS